MSNIDFVLRGYTKLSEAERKRVREEIEKYEKEAPFWRERKSEEFNESVRRVTGPSSSTGKCTCCGR